MMSAIARFTTAVAGGPQAAPAARRSLCPLERILGRALFQDVALLVSELVTNSVRHGGVGADERIELSVIVRADRVRVEVRDPRPPFRPPAQNGPPQTNDAQLGGWGLMLVSQLARAWGTLAPSEVKGLRHAGVWFELGLESDRMHAPLALPG